MSCKTKMPTVLVFSAVLNVLYENKIRMTNTDKGAGNFSLLDYNIIVYLQNPKNS